ncbi:MAG: neutral/alkaline non-lysosomal ceramidase N-terminal domain-containing protein [Pirellulales bacterium]
MLICYVSLAMPAYSQDQWKAGIAKSIITPDQPMWMSGYASRTKPAEDKRHDLWAKALVLQDADNHQAVIVTLDLVGIGRDISISVQKRIKDLHQLERSQIALCSSHTHTGPVVGNNLSTMYFYDQKQQMLVDQYAQQLVNNIVATVSKAIDNLQPALLSQTTGQAKFAVNRRNNKEADVSKLRNEDSLQGPVDHSLPILKISNTTGKTLGILFGYACHATVLSDYQWSGDWPGFAQLEIEKRHPGAIAMFWAGCGADQNPLPRRTVELAQNYGKQIAAGIDDAFKNPLSEIKGRLRTSYSEIELPFGELPSRTQMESDTKSKNRYLASRAEHLLKQLDSEGKLPATYPYPIQVWTIGNEIKFVLLGGEVVVDYAHLIKTEVLDNQTWVAAYSNDVMAYIPSRRVLTEGGYEGSSSMIYYGQPTTWSPKCEQLIADSVKSLYKQIQSKD